VNESSLTNQGGLSMIEHTLPKGTVTKLKGLPVELLTDCKVLMSEHNYKLFLSQSEHSVLNPVQAAPPDNRATNNESLASI
jgi:hypothetical protein